MGKLNTKKPHYFARLSTMNMLNQNIGHDTDKLSPAATDTDTSHRAQIVLEEKRNQAVLLPCPDGPQEKPFLLNEEGRSR